jgi:hypothetical protein
MLEVPEALSGSKNCKEFKRIEEYSSASSTIADFITLIVLIAVFQNIWVETQ